MIQEANYYKQFDQLYEYFSVELGWEVSKDRIYAGNLLVYFRNSFNEWRLTDTSKNTSMDLTSIKFPLDDAEKSRLWNICSYSFKTEPKKIL